MKILIFFISIFCLNAFSYLPSQSIEIIKESSGKSICKGSLITSSWILTASHCFKNNSKYFAVVDNLKVEIVSAPIEPSMSDSFGHSYDMALARIAQPLNIDTPYLAGFLEDNLFVDTDNHLIKLQSIESDKHYIKGKLGVESIPGQSGSPIYLLQGEHFALVGVLISNSGSSSQSSTTYQRINSEVLEWIRSITQEI